MEAKEGPDVSAPEMTDLKVPDKTPAQGDEKENLLNGNANLQVKEAHNDEDDGTGSDGFELIDVKENFGSTKMEEETAAPSTKVDTSPVKKESDTQEEKTATHEEQSVAENTRHLDSSMLNQQTEQLGELTRRIEELESEKGKLVKDLTEAENKQSLQHGCVGIGSWSFKRDRRSRPNLIGPRA
jgi:hypothetical protein